MGARGKADVEIPGRVIRGLVLGERTGFGPAMRMHCVRIGVQRSRAWNRFGLRGRKRLRT